MFVQATKSRRKGKTYVTHLVGESSRLLFPCAKPALKDQACGTLLASACGLCPEESFDEDDLYAAMDAITGHWCA